MLEIGCKGTVNLLDMRSEDFTGDSMRMHAKIDPGMLGVACFLCLLLIGQGKKVTLANLNLSSSGTSISSSAPTCVIMSQISSCVGAAMRIHKHLLRTGSITCESREHEVMQD